jgi:hypothetical protein
MTLPARIFLCFAALLALCALAAPVWAADGAQTLYTIHIQEALTSLIVLVFGALSAVASWLIALILGRLARKFGLQIHNEVTSAVDSAVQEGLRWAKNLALEKAKRIDDPKVRSEIIANAADYVLVRFPKILSDAGLGEASLRELVASHLPVTHTQEAAGASRASG